MTVLGAVKLSLSKYFLAGVIYLPCDTRLGEFSFSLLELIFSEDGFMLFTENFCSSKTTHLESFLNMLFLIECAKWVLSVSLTNWVAFTNSYLPCSFKPYCSTFTIWGKDSFSIVFSLRLFWPPNRDRFWSLYKTDFLILGKIIIFDSSYSLSSERFSSIYGNLNGCMTSSKRNCPTTPISWSPSSFPGVINSLILSTWPSKSLGVFKSSSP